MYEYTLDIFRNEYIVIIFVWNVYTVYVRFQMDRVDLTHLLD